MQFFDIHIVSIVSSISARKCKGPSSARLGAARAGKFQLELISTIYFPTAFSVYFLRSCVFGERIIYDFKVSEESICKLNGIFS